MNKLMIGLAAAGFAFPAHAQEVYVAEGPQPLWLAVSEAPAGYVQLSMETQVTVRLIENVSTSRTN